MLTACSTSPEPVDIPQAADQLKAYMKHWKATVPHQPDNDSACLNDNDDQSTEEEDEAYLCRVVVTGSRISAADVRMTNVQHEGVDEGGLVKYAFGHIIILRRGKLYAVDPADNRTAPRLTDRFDLAELQRSEDAWFDEILVRGNLLVLIGYDYHADATTIDRFTINADGQFHYQDTIGITSGDYFSSSNYAGRLLGDELLVYFEIRLNNADLGTHLPHPQIAVSQAGWSNVDWQPVVESKDVVVPTFLLKEPTVHGFLRCPVAEAQFQCSTNAILAEPDSEHYVSPEAAYLWTYAWSEYELYQQRYWSDSPRYRLKDIEQSWQSYIVQMPFYDKRPGWVSVSGMPLDRESFRIEGQQLFALMAEAENSKEEISTAFFVLDLSEFDISGSQMTRLGTLPLAYWDSPLKIRDGKLYLAANRAMQSAEGYVVGSSR
ncbi:MAG: beta-propeller domain-containing protein, partial [Pseudomonadota bacterium]